MNRIVLVLGFLAGCKAGAPDCAEIANKYVAMIGWKDFPKEKRDAAEAAIKAEVAGACRDDHWSAEARECMRDAENRKTLEDNCGWKLGREARERLSARLAPLVIGL
jgi:hypothetical protein